MRSALLIILFSATTLLINSCVDEIKIDIPSSANHLVVDGMITDLPGPYTIRLSYSNDYFEPYSPNTSDYNIKDLAQKARVLVVDDQGNEEIFEEISPGLYQSSKDGMQGQVGTSYTLKIELENGKQYESKTEVMPENVGIKDYHTEFTSKRYLDESNFERTTDGLNISVTPNDFNGTYEFYRWRWEGTYKIFTSPELRTKNVMGQAVPDPPECAFNYIETPTEFRCECCICWVTEPSTSSIVSSKVLGDAQTFIRFLENSQSRFVEPYHLKIEQLSITKEAYEFWNIIKQQENSDSPFAISNTEIPTNMVSLSDKDEKVLGFFSAASVKEVSFFLSNTLLETKPVLMETVKNDCRFQKNSTNVKPLFW